MASHWSCEQIQNVPFKSVCMKPNSWNQRMKCVSVIDVLNLKRSSAPNMEVRCVTGDSTNCIINCDHCVSSEEDSSRCGGRLLWSTSHLLHSVSIWQGSDIIISIQADTVTPDKPVTVPVLRVKLKSDPIKKEGPKVSPLKQINTLDVDVLCEVCGPAGICQL